MLPASWPLRPAHPWLCDGRLALRGDAVIQGPQGAAASPGCTRFVGCFRGHAAHASSVRRALKNNRIRTEWLACILPCPRELPLPEGDAGSDGPLFSAG